MDDTRREINMGSEVCRRIKLLRYPETPWAEIYKTVAKEFNTVKERAKAFYPDDPILTVLTHIRTWSDEDIADCFE